MFRRFTKFTISVFCVSMVASAVHARDTCAAVDFLAMDLSSVESIDLVEAALMLAYPSLVIVDGSVHFENGTRLPIGVDRGLLASDRLQNPTVREQFSQKYPLEFDLSEREKPWMDPGRARNDAFFRNLYFATKKDAAQTLEQVTYQDRAAFKVTRRECVAEQLRAAFNEIQAIGPRMNVYFEKTGGSFNWRAIAGTDRLSAHSFGIAVDLNTDLGGYWRWSGMKEGEAGAYANRYPAEIVQAMERFGFIWGGKWHHFDGMHFEYRPEMILFSRLAG